MAFKSPPKSSDHRKPGIEAPDDKPKTDSTGTAEKKVTFPVPTLGEGVHYIFGTGRRKKAVARVRIRPGSGKILINKRELDQFFVHEKDRSAVVAPLHSTGMVTSWDIWANVNGGGSTGQADAVKLGLARALAKAIPQAESTLRDSHLLTRDARIKERKKYGQRGARRRFQFSKR